MSLFLINPPPPPIPIHSVSKRIAPSSAQDLDLSQPLFVIYARRLGISPNLDTIDSHANGGIAVRGATPSRLLATNSTGTADENIFETVHRPNLIRAHGVLMIIAWPLLAVTAIFFALFMRPALPNGEWFQVTLKMHSLKCTLHIIYVGSSSSPTVFPVHWSCCFHTDLHCSGEFQRPCGCHKCELIIIVTVYT